MVVCERPVGVDVLVCINQQAEFFPAYSILVLVFLVVAVRTSREPAKEQLAAATFATALVGFVLGALNLLPDRAIQISLVLAIGAAALLVVQRR